MASRIATSGVDVPILGVNFGSLGFLTETRIDELYSALESVVDGAATYDHRNMLVADVTREGRAFDSRIVLNDVVFTKGALSRIIEVFTEVGITAEGKMSMQSMDEGTLATIKRKNIKVQKYDDLSVEFSKNRLPLSVELMMGLPGSSLTTLRNDLPPAPRPLAVFAGGVAVHRITGLGPVLRKRRRVEPLRRGRMIEVRVADQLSPVGRADAVQIGVDVVVGHRERQAAAKLDDGGDVPAVEDVTESAIPAPVVVDLPVQAHAEDVALVGVRAAVLVPQLRVVLGEALRGVVHQLHARHRLAEGVEAAEADAVPRAHGRRDLQAVVGRVLIGV
jgi:hypothetical protein